MSEQPEELSVPEVFCFCAGLMASIEDCETDCKRRRQMHSIARAFRPRGAPVEHPPRLQ